MIGSGIFLLPSVMAPYGAISLLGWTMSGIGVILMAAVFGRLARRTKNGVGGPYAYTRDAFGTLAGFLIGWGYWLSVTIAVVTDPRHHDAYIASHRQGHRSNSNGDA